MQFSDFLSLINLVPLVFLKKKKKKKNKKKDLVSLVYNPIYKSGHNEKKNRKIAFIFLFRGMRFMSEREVKWYYIFM